MVKSLTRIVKILLLSQLCLFKAYVFSNPVHGKGFDAPSDRFLDRLSEPAAQALILNMRTQFALENCMLHFDFLNTVKGSNTVKKINGLMLIAKSNASSEKRIYLSNDDQWVEFIVHDGVGISVWKRDAQSPTFQLVKKSLWFEPLIDGVLFRPVDLIMPYLQWSTFQYEGPQVIGVRSVIDDFIFIPDDDLIYKEYGIDSIRLSIDRQYKGIRKVEYLREASILSTLSVLGVKKFKGLWALSRLSLKANGAKTIFKLNKLTPVSNLDADLYFNPSNENILSISDYLIGL
ncbi:MAG: hypothetical protein CML12_02415 [Puniceicoccaceae bacterium]|nr:hypothetical protein [Puniceicoccaceae bacterium]RCL30967.1 MAG: hypothetical protein DBX03_01435 [Puniceicoccaceae bacterium]